MAHLSWLIPRLRLGACALGLLGAVAPALASSEAPGPPGPVAVTLEEATARALEHAPQVVQALGSTRTAAAAERSALGAWLPTASLSAGSGLAGTTRINPPTNPGSFGLGNSLSAGVSASWEVFSGGRHLAGQVQAEALSHTAGAQLVQQRSAVTLAVEQAFFEEQRAEELLAVAQARIERARQGAEAAERRAAVGSATRSDVLRAQLELNLAREAQRQAETQRHGAAFTLGRLIGVEGPADARLTAPLQPTPLAVSGEELVRSLVSEAPAVRVAEANLRATGAGVGLARAQYLPSVRLTAGYEWSQTELPLLNGQGNGSLRVGMSWPLFDGFLREEGMERAQVQEQVASAVLADARRAVRVEAERVLGLLRLEQERIGFAEQALQVAQEDLRVQQERYQLGVSTMLDLLTSQASLVEAERALVSARFDYQLARAELEALAGRRL